jgi:flagella basal body P-ring formation protein FlgA
MQGITRLPLASWARAAILLGPLTLHAAVVSIDMPRTATVRGETVRLGQVAHLTSQDLDTMRRLTMLPLGSIAHQAEGIQLDRARLARWIRSQTGLRDHDIEWKGEASTHISYAQTRLEPQLLIDTAQAALSEWLTQRTERFHIRPVSSVPILALSDDTTRLLVKPIRHERPHTRMHVMVDVINSQGVVRTVTLAFQVTAHVKGLVAGQDMAARSQAAALLEERDIEVTALAPHASPLPAAQAASVAALQLKRSVKAGEFIQTRDLEPVPAVQRGDWITLYLVQGDIRMQSRAEALQSGQPGQNIRVKPTGAEQSMLARVTGRNMAEVSR